MISALQYEPLLCVYSLTSSSITRLLCWDPVFTWFVVAVWVLWWHFKALGAGAVTDYTPLALDILPSPRGRILLFHFLPEPTLGAVSSTQGPWYCRALPTLCQTCPLSKDVTSVFLLPSFPGPISSILVNRYGSRPVVMFGGLLCGVGMISAAFCTSILQLYVCVGFITGENKPPPSPPCMRLPGAPTAGHCVHQHKHKAGEIESLWDKNLVGQRPSLSMLQMNFSKENIPCSVFLAGILCGIQAGLGAGDGGHQCPQLSLKQTQLDCALPWAKQVLLGTRCD